MSEFDWHEYFFQMCNLIATKSKDRSTKVGTVIVGPDNDIRSTGYNGFPRGVNDDIDSRHDRPIKYMYTEHAERNAIFNAARTSTSLNGCRIYVNYYPCDECARAIIQSGISKVLINSKMKMGEHWNESCDCAKEMFDEAGIEVELIEIRC
jgi:dCMP deaminase